MKIKLRCRYCYGVAEVQAFEIEWMGGDAMAPSLCPSCDVRNSPDEVSDEIKAFNLVKYGPMPELKTYSALSDYTHLDNDR